MIFSNGSESGIFPGRSYGAVLWLELFQGLDVCTEKLIQVQNSGSLQGCSSDAPGEVGWGGHVYWGSV